MIKKLLNAVALSGFVMSSVSFAQEIGTSGSELTKIKAVGLKILTDKNGMSLYTFDRDEGGASNCYDECAVAWPPILTAQTTTVTAPYGTTERKDGTKQLTINGKPLYLFFKDKISGDINGDGVGKVWHLVKLP